MQKYLTNVTGSTITVEGQEILPSEYYLIQDTEISKFRGSNELITHIASGSIIVAKSDDGTGNILDISTAIDYLKTNLPDFLESASYPFTSKILRDGRKIYKRTHGVSGSPVLAGQSSTTIYTIPYLECKITAVEVIGSGLGDQVNFKILDTAAGTVSGVPNYTLNQFGFNVYVSSGMYREESSYEADLFQGLQLEMEYINNGVDVITPNYNITLHEVK